MCRLQRLRLYLLPIQLPLRVEPKWMWLLRHLLLCLPLGKFQLPLRWRHLHQPHYLQRLLSDFRQKWPRQYLLPRRLLLPEALLCHSMLRFLLQRLLHCLPTS